MSSHKPAEKKDDFDEKSFMSFISEAGLIWGPEPEIYGGLSGFYTYGPLGKLLKNRVENSVRSVFNSVNFREIEGPTVMPDRVWKASGHLGTFSDRIITCSKCKAVFRPDKLIEEKMDVSADSFSDKEIIDTLKDKKINCPSCKGYFDFSSLARQSLMMKTNVMGTEASLRPETATVTYLPYVRMYQYFRKKLPFGVFQIGKAYRNEISPRQHVLRGREFTQAEGQLFIDPKEKNNWEQFEKVKGDKMPLWDYNLQTTEKSPVATSLSDALKKKLLSSQAYAWCLHLAYTQFRNFGIPAERIRVRQHHPDERAFYAADAWDIEIKTNNFGWVEVCGVHDRTDYDLKQHSKESGVVMEAQRENGEKFVPHILEIAFGTDRPTYAIIDLFYQKKSEEEGKSLFAVPYKMAPISVSVFPLMKKDELVILAENIRNYLSKQFIVDYDASGSIGKRYLRSMTAGTPFAVTVDFDSLTDNAVTVRDRDSGKQERVKIDDLSGHLHKLINSP
ncbi:MAG: glycine--tRNA ligase [Candidatus Pacearchaeota archaeon]